jgi:2-amino-4-hydroxy-6-hydroxymethyldihydropteridine diphosphokinase
MNTAYILTGANLGDRLASLQTAKQHLADLTGDILTSSLVYLTEAWGNTGQRDFYNQVHIIHTRLSPQQLMATILEIESKMGRIRTVKNASRIIDIDILFFNDSIINEKDLVIPHPEIGNRRFVLTPLNELSPRLEHPVLHKPISDLLSTCPDKLRVTPLPSF